jgi:hypothetical protein
MNNFKLYENLSFILGVLITWALCLLLSSCVKNENPKYVILPDKVDTTKWEDEYVNAGTIPTIGNTNNGLYGTDWKIVKYVTAFATEYPNDTIHFINNTQYRLNSQTVSYKYVLTTVTGSTNYSLTLYYFSPFGGSHYGAQIGHNYATDGVMNNIIFNDLYNSVTLKVWLVKL